MKCKKKRRKEQKNDSHFFFVCTSERATGYTVTRKTINDGSVNCQWDSVSVLYWITQWILTDDWWLLIWFTCLRSIICLLSLLTRHFRDERYFLHRIIFLLPSDTSLQGSSFANAIHLIASSRWGRASSSSSREQLDILQVVFLLQKSSSCMRATLRNNRTCDDQSNWQGQSAVNACTMTTDDK